MVRQAKVTTSSSKLIGGTFEGFLSLWSQSVIKIVIFSGYLASGQGCYEKNLIQKTPYFQIDCHCPTWTISNSILSFFSAQAHHQVAALSVHLPMRYVYQCVGPSSLIWGSNHSWLIRILQCHGSQAGWKIGFGFSRSPSRWRCIANPLKCRGCKKFLSLFQFG